MIKADTVVTDPVWPNCPEGLLAGWKDPAGLLGDALEALPESIVRLSIIVRSDSDPRFFAAVPERWPFVCVQAMSYAVPMYVGRVLGGTELAYGFGVPIPSSEGRHLLPMWGPIGQPQGRRPNGHPCSRHIEHMRWLVNWWSEPDEIVLDPFMGSGTILRAAKDTGRRAIGIEIEERFCEIAVERLAQRVMF